MNLLQRMAGRCDDWINPIAVKETRQAVQGRFVAVILLLSLLASVLALAGPIFADGGRSRDLGLSVYFPLLAGLLVTTIVLVPLNTSQRMRREWLDNDLLFVTTLSPGRIIRGKLASAMLLAGLIFGAIMPFITVTYLLRGLDAPSILLSLLVGLAGTALGVQMAILAAAFQLGRILSGLVGLVLAGGLLHLAGGSIFACSRMVQVGIASQAGSALFWAWAGTIAVLWLIAMGLLHALSVCAISSPVTNRTLPVRLFTAAAAAVSGLIAWAWSDGGDGGPMVLWSNAVLLLAGAMLVAAAGERREYSLRQKRRIPGPLYLRIFAFAAFSGVAGGVLWSLLLAGAALAAYALHAASAPGWTGLDASVLACALFTLQVLGYTLLGVLAQRLFAPAAPPFWASLLAVFLMIAGMLLPPALAHLTASPERWRRLDLAHWLLPNPFAAFWEDRGFLLRSRLGFALATTGAAALAALPVLAASARGFRPERPPKPAAAEEAAAP